MKSLVLNFREIERVTAGKWRNLPDDGLEFSRVNFFLPYVGSGDLYVCRSSEDETVEAVQSAFRRGAVAAIVRKGSINATKYPLLEVADPLKALQDIAIGASLKFDGTRILVTGSHGKTGFKTQLYHIAHKQIPLHAFLDSANLEAPVWRTLASLPKGAAAVIVETAIPAPGFGEDRSFFIRPDYCVITGIGPEHLSSHKSLENLIRNKASVVTGMRPGGRCLLNADDDYYDELRRAVEGISKCELLTFGSTPGCDGRLLSNEFHDSHWRVRAEILGETVEYDLPLMENYAPLASVSVLLMAKLLGADLNACAAEYADYRNYESSGNLYRVPLGKSAFYVYDQTHRGELKGFESMFELMSRLHPQGEGRKIAVVSEFINQEDNPGFVVDTERMRTLMAQSGMDVLYSVKEFKRFQEVVPNGVEWRKHGESQEDILDDLLDTVRENDMVFLRGVLSAKLGRLVKALLEKGSGTVEKIY